jgi:azurin
MKKHIFSLALASLLFGACGGGEAPETTSGNETPATETTTQAQAPEVVEIVIESNDQMKYNLDRIDVMAGQTVRLTLKHVGQMAKEAMGHNWVLVAKGTDLAEFGGAAAAAAATDYIPAEFESQVIAHTSTIGGGEEVTIEFTAPEKGIYDFFCSFPGHYAMMRGKFVVL